jgi:CHAD domain-containing protein
MQSNVAKQILEETSKELRILVRQYTEIVIMINQVLQAKECAQKEPTERTGKNIIR